MFQNDLENYMGISRSYCSELLGEMEEEKQILRKKSGTTRIIYSVDNFPGSVDGIVRVGLLKSSEYVPALAMLLEYSAERGIEVRVVPYLSVPEMLRALTSGALDIAMAPTIPTVTFGLMSPNLKVITGIASGGSAVISQPSSCGDCTLTSESSTMVTMVIMAHILSSSTSTYEDPSNGTEQFLKGKCCRIAIWEPYLQKLMVGGNYKIEFSYSSVLDNFPCCTLSTNEGFLGANSEIVSYLKENYVTNPTMSMDSSHGKAAVDSIARITGINRRIVVESLLNYDFRPAEIKIDLLTGLGVRITQKQYEGLFRL